jgi:hypothetical protein
MRIVVEPGSVHFDLRRLERTYGSAHIRQHYATLAIKLPKLAG